MTKETTTYFGEINFFPHQATTPAVESLSWLTGVTESVDGTEDRHSAVSTPKQIYDYKFPLNHTNKRQAINSIYSGIRDEWYIPTWTESQYVGDITSGQTSISCNTLLYNFNMVQLGGVGVGIAALYSGNEYQIVEYTAKTYANITVLDTDAMLGCYLMPVKKGIILGSPKEKTNGTESELQFKFMIDWNLELTGSTPEQYQTLGGGFSIVNDAAFVNTRVTANSEFIFVATSSALYQLDIDTYSTVNYKTIPASGTDSIQNIVCSDDYVVRLHQTNCYVDNISDLSQHSTFSMWSTGLHDGAIDGSNVYFSDTANRRYVVQTVAGAYLSYKDYGGSNTSASMAIGDSYIYVSQYADGTVKSFDKSTNDLVSIAIVDGPLAIDFDGTNLVVLSADTVHYFSYDLGTVEEYSIIESYDDISVGYKNIVNTTANIYEYVITDSVTDDIYYDKMPMISKAMDKRIVKQQTITDFKIGPFDSITNWTGTKVGSPHTEILVGPSEVTSFRYFLYRRAGKYRQFWSPSFASDMIAVSTGLVETELLVSSDLIMDYSQDRTHIAILDTSGTWYPREIAGFSQIDTSRVELTLDSSLDLQAENIVSISYMGIYRLNSDSATITWMGNNVANVKTSVLELAP